MSQQPDRSEPGVGQLLWTFLKAMTGSPDESERIRLTVTGLPSILACRLSGVALLINDGEWTAVAQKDNHIFAQHDGEKIANQLRGFFDSALKRGPNLVVNGTVGQEPLTLCSSLKEENIYTLAATPLLTLRQPIGVVFVGRDQPFSVSEERILSTVADYTALGIENLRIRRELEEVAATYRALYDETPVMMHSIGADGRLTHVNDHWLRVMGYEWDEVLGRFSSEFLTKASREYAERVVLPQMRRTGRVKDIAYQWVKKDGEIIDVLLSAVSTSDERGQFARGSAFIVDVTEKKRMEQALHASEESYRQLYEHTPVMMLEISREYTLRNVNDQWLTVLGYEQDQVLGRPIADFMTPDSGRHATENELPRLFETGTMKEREYQFVKQNSEMLDVILSAVTEADPTEDADRALAFMLDVTERKLAERQAAERTADLESFSYSVSHDLRAPLRAIDGFSRILQEDHGELLGPDAQRLLNVIRDSAHNMGQLIEDLLTFSRTGRQEMSLGKIDMEEVAGEVFRDLLTAQPHGEIKLHIKKLPMAWGDGALIRQVFVNLLSNAIKFSTSRQAPTVEIGHRRNENAADVYYVKDNGVGFDMRYADKLFGVFQRLHAGDEFEGTGVGLAIVQRIVQRHGGRVWAESTLGEGSTIYFTLSAQSS